MKSILLARFLKKVMSCLERSISISTGFTGFVALICMFLICTAVGSRYIFNYNILGTLDIAQIMLVLIIFIPLAYVEKHGGHLRITILYSFFSQRAKSILDLIARIETCTLLSFMSGMALLGTFESLVERDTSWGELAIPLWIPKLFIFLGCLMLFLYSLTILLLIIFKKNNGALE